MNLSQEQLEAISALSAHPAYQLVMDRVQAEIDTLEQELDASESNELDLRRLNQWRALRKVHGILRVTPQEASLALQVQAEEGPFVPEGTEVQAPWNTEGVKKWLEMTDHAEAELEKLGLLGDTKR